MKIQSDSFEHGKPIPPDFAMGARDGQDGFGGNRNPHLAWTDAPAGTQSFALLCIDTDAPTDGARPSRSRAGSACRARSCRFGFSCGVSGPAV
ncbi:MAG: hypothetical protein EOO24_67425 [Comamonadaceae bacterium]|nr:MAG: hypothetical protein EOO24_67425 [Comamonadaceae bacterium]